MRIVWKILVAVARDGLYGIGLLAVILILVLISAKSAHFIYAMF